MLTQSAPALGSFLHSEMRVKMSLIPENVKHTHQAG